jgi:predicted GNAT family acetyltransferase
MPQDNEALKGLYSMMKSDEVFSEFIGDSPDEFAKRMTNPDALSGMHQMLVNDEVFSEFVPADINEAAKKFGFSSGKPLAEPTKSGGSGSATKRTPQNVELQSQFPTNLQADQTQELIESNIQGAELAGLDYEAISKQMAGKSPIDVAFEQVNKIQDPEEKFNTTRSLYKLAINDVSDANTNIRGNVEQMEQGMLQMQEQYEQGLNQYNQLLEQGDQESANIIGEELNKQQENLKLAATQYEDLVKEYNDNAKFLGILNAGRAASYQTAKGQEGLTAGKLPIGAAMFSNMIGGTTIQFSPEEAKFAATWNTMTPNLVRTLASGIEIADYFVRPGSLESTNLSKMAGDALLDFANDIEVETEKFVPKGTELNIFKELNPYSAGQFAGSLIGSVAGSIGSGGLAGTGKAAMVFNAAQGYGGMYGWGKEAGLSSAEASALAAPVGLVYGYLGDKGVESLASVVGRESFKKIVLKGIKELGKDKTPKALSEVFLKSLQEFGKNTVKGAARETPQEMVEFSSEFGMKVLASETGLAKTEDDLTFDAFMSGLEDSMKGGALGGGLLGGLLGASPRRTLATVVSESVNDPIKEQDFMDNMNALLNGTQIDQQQYDDVMQMYNRAKEVNNTVPSNVTNEQARAEAIDLIQERDDLQAQVEVIDPAMAKPFTDRIASIDKRLGEISEGKSITQPEDIQQQQEGMTEIIQPETPVETVDLTPQETPVQPTETIEQPKAEVAESPALSDVDGTDSQHTAGYAIIALDYLFTGGRDVILSTDYLLQALVGGFEHASKEIDVIRNKYAGKLGNIKDDINSDAYNSAMQEIRDAINRKYNNKQAEAIFDKILNNATGFTSREGNQVSIELDNINSEVESLLSKEQEAQGQQEVETPSSNYEIAQEVTSEVSKENPNASVLLTPKGNDLSLTAVFVPSERRNQGIGTKVLESVKKQADRVGKKVVLEATNELDSETDIERLGNFYERNGFTRTGENTFEYDPSKKESIEEEITLKTQEDESGENKQIVNEKDKSDSRNEEIANELQKRVRKAYSDEADSKRDGKRIDLRSIDNRVAYEYALETGTLIGDIYTLGRVFIGGNEHTTAIDENEQKIFKSNNLINTGSLDKFFDKIRLHNKIFPETRYSFEGFSAIDAGGKSTYIEPVYSQDFIKEAENATPQEISDFMISEGFEKIEAFRYRKGDIEVWDVRPRNVLKDKNGNFYVIDAEFKELKPQEKAVAEENKTQEEVDPFAALEQVANELEKAAQDEAKKKSFSSQMNNIVDRIDRLIDDIDNSNIALSSIPFARQIARTALKIFRDAFDAAGRTPEAFRKAMQAMRDALSRDTDYKNLDRQQQAELIKDLSNEILDNNPFNFQGDERVSKFASRVSKIYANVNDVYTSQSQEKVRQEVITLIDELGLDVVLEYAESAGVPSGVKTAILGEAFGRAKAAFDANPTPENRKAFNEATERLKQWGTDAGQGVAYFNKIYELFPELQVEQFQEDLNKQTEDNLGNQGKKNVEKIKTETKKIRNDVFSAIANFFNDGVTNIAAVTDSKVKKALDVLLSFGKKLNPEQKSALSTLLDNVRNSGLLEIAQTKEAVREQVLTNLKDINGRLSNPLSDSDLNKVADSFVEAYEYVAQKLIEGAINTAFQDSKKSGQQDKNSKIARLILYGALDNPQTLNAFAQKFGIPSITPQQASQLRTLAQRVNQSKGGQKAAAQRQLTTYINGLKKAANSVFARQMQRVGDAGNDLGSLIINNILFGVTAGFAYISNLTRTVGAAIGSLVKGETDAIKFALKEGMNQQFTLPNGQVIDLKLRPVRDAILAATSGIPRLSEYLLAGISDQEMKIRQAKTRAERIARRIFLTASMRLYSAVDASVVPYYKAMTKYSIMKKLVLQMYKDNKQPKPSKVELDKQVRGLIGLDVTNFDAIVERAYENTMNSTLVDDLVAQGAWNKNNPMPDASSRNNPNSAAAQVYNEFITNIYELHESDFYNRFLELQNSKDNLGNDIFDTGKAGMYARMLKDVDRVLAKNTNEMAFYGRPSGFEGQMYDVLISINNKVPGLKYSGYSPLFVGAAMNGAAYARKTYPVVNAISYAYYKARGKRISDFGNDGEFETDFGMKIDQNNMLQAVVSSTIATAAIAAWLFSRYDTPEEEEQAFKDRNWSGYVNDLNFAQSQSFFDRNGNKLQKGFLYINGYPAMPVYRLPVFGMFEAAGFLKNYGTLTQSKKSEDLFKDEEEEERYKGVLGAYLINGYLLSLRLSQTKELAESITKILSATPDDLGSSSSEKIQKDFENKMSRLAANLIPFNQAQRQIADLFVNAEGGYNRKVASTFAEKIAMQTAFQHWMVKSNMVDPFGRPIPEVFDVRGLTLGFNMFEFDKNGNIYTFLDKAYAGDKYMKLHLDKEYLYTSNHTKIIPVTVELEGEGIDVPAAKKIVKELKESGVEAQLPEKAMGTLTTDEVKYYTYNMELDDDEINIMNEEAAKQVKKLVDEAGNYQVLSNPELTKRAYRQFMDKAYKYATTLQVYKMHSEELGEAYLNTVKKQYKNLQNDPIVKELGLVIPSGWSID